MAWPGGQDGYFFGTNIVSDQNPARENFRQRADTAGADLFPAQLLHAGDVGLGDQIELRPIRNGKNDSDIGALNGGTDRRSGGRRELRAVAHRRLNGLNRLHDDQLDV